MSRVKEFKSVGEAEEESSAEFAGLDIGPNRVADRQAGRQAEGQSSKRITNQQKRYSQRECASIDRIESEDKSK